MLPRFRMLPPTRGERSLDLEGVLPQIPAACALKKPFRAHLSGTLAPYLLLSAPRTQTSSSSGGSEMTYTRRQGRRPDRANGGQLKQDEHQ